MIEDGIWLTSLRRVAGVARLTGMNLEKDETIRNDLYQWKEGMDSVENEANCESVHVCMCVLRIEDKEEKNRIVKNLMMNDNRRWSIVEKIGAERRRQWQLRNL